MPNIIEPVEYFIAPFSAGITTEVGAGEDEVDWE